MSLKYFTREITQYMGDDIVEKAGRVWITYVYDDEVGHHLADISACYECHPVTTFTEHRVDDDLHAELQEHEPTYFYCYSVKGHDVPYARFNPDEEEYEEWMESALEYCRANCGMFERIPEKMQ